MHIAIPPRPSPLSQDSISTLSSSGPSSSASTTSIIAAPGRCIHRPSDRPPTPYPGECQLCLASEHLGEGQAKKKESLGALAEEEEEEGGGSSSVAQTAGQQKEEVTLYPSTSRRSSGSSTSTMDSGAEIVTPSSCTSACSSSSSIHSATSVPAANPSEQLTSLAPVKPRSHGRRPSWLRKLLSSDSRKPRVGPSTSPALPPSTHALPAQSLAQEPRAYRAACDLAPNATTSNIAQPRQSPSTNMRTTTTSRPARRETRIHFAATSLMPTVGYSYTLENSVWKAPPVVGPMVKKTPAVLDDEERWLVVGMSNSNRYD